MDANKFRQVIQLLAEMKDGSAAEVSRLRDRIARLDVDAAEDKAALGRCRDMIEMLCVALEEARGGMANDLTKTARVYLNFLEYGNPKGPVKYTNYSEHAVDVISKHFDKADENHAKETAARANKKTSSKKAPSKGKKK